MKGTIKLAVIDGKEHCSVAVHSQLEEVKRSDRFVLIDSLARALDMSDEELLLFIAIRGKLYEHIEEISV